MNKYLVSKQYEKVRLDKYLSTFNSDISRTYLSSLIDNGYVLVNAKKEKASYRLKENDEISLDIPIAKPLEVNKENIPLDIVYEDEDILIINKPQGLVVHPSCGHNEHTLVNAILYHCTSLSGINGVLRPGIVHRIDKDTSGLLCVAKNDKSHHFLAEQLKSHTMARTYKALVIGEIKENKGHIDLPIGRDKHNRQKMCVTKENSKEAITDFVVEKRFNGYTLVDVSLHTGRTHQIRVHMSHIGYPVVGDMVYGGRHADKLYNNGQLLVAYKLKLIHPTTKKEMEFEIPLPKYFLDVVNSLS